MNHQSLSLRRTAERGAAATLVAILAATGVLLGALAVSVDVGNLMLERRQLQNAADATAMALAQICAGSAAACKEGPTFDELDTLANANTRSSDSLMSEEVCGARLPTGAVLPPCDHVPSTAISDLTMCPALPAWLGAPSTIPYVETYTQTEDLQSFFTGGETTITNCARAAWGPTSVSEAKIIPITMSECKWVEATGGQWGGTGNPVYPPGPNGDFPGYGIDRGSGIPDNPWPNEIVGYTKGGTTTCPTSPPGGTTSGAFGILENDACQSEVELGSDGYYWVKDRQGNPLPCPQLQQFYGQVVHVPIFDCITGVQGNTSAGCDSGGGNPTWYRVKGFAAFYVSGYYFSSGTKKSLKTGNAPCSGGDRCLAGWFLRDLVPGGEIDLDGGEPNYGLTAVQPAG